MYYPVFLDLRAKRVLVVGAGPVALRKVRGLLECEAKVTVVSPEALKDFETVPVKLHKRKFRQSDIQDQALIFAATNDRVVNKKIAAAASRRGIPVNVADSPEECSFQVPSRIRRGNLQVAVSTSGRSPKLAVHLRKQIEAILDGGDS